MLSHSDTFFGNSDFLHKLMLYKCFPNKKTAPQLGESSFRVGKMAPFGRLNIVERREDILSKPWIGNSWTQSYVMPILMICVLWVKKNSIFLQKSTILHSGWRKARRAGTLKFSISACLWEWISQACKLMKAGEDDLGQTWLWVLQRVHWNHTLWVYIFSDIKKTTLIFIKIKNCFPFKNTRHVLENVLTKNWKAKSQMGENSWTWV